MNTNNLHDDGAVVVHRQLAHSEYVCNISAILTFDSLDETRFSQLLSSWFRFHQIPLYDPLTEHRLIDEHNKNCVKMVKDPNLHVFRIEVPLPYMDVSSFVLLLSELGKCYEKNTEISLHTSQGYSHDNNSISTQLSYWLSYLQGSSFQLDLHQKKPKLTKAFTAVSEFHLQFDQQLIHNANLYSSKEQVDLEDVLLATLFSTLSRYSHNNEIVLGNFVNTRKEEHDYSVGCFTNYLPLRITDIRMLSFEALVQQVHKRRATNKSHSGLTLLDILKVLQESSPNTDGVFSVGFQYQPRLPAKINFGTSECILSDFQWIETTSEDLMFRFNEGQGMLKVFYQNYIGCSFVKQLCSSLEVVLENGVQQPTHEVQSVNILSLEERGKLMKFHGDSVFRPYTKSIHQIFEDQVAKTPSAIALKYLDSTVTYQDLNSQSNQLARFLRNQRNIQIGERVGIFLERSVQSVVAVIACMKAGAIYVPLDPKYPMDRIQYIVEDAHPTVILTTSPLSPKLIKGVPSYPSTSVLSLDEVTSSINSEECTNLPFQVEEQPIANLLFTSGSTGNPKGVMVQHRSIVNRIFWEQVQVTQDDVFCHIVSLNFIDSLWDIFMPLTNGLPLVVVPVEMIADLDQFLAYLTEHKVTRIVLVPSFLNQILNSDLEQLKQLPVQYWTTSGEAVSVELCEKFMERMPNKTLINIYGTTEVWDATVYVCNDYFTTTPRPCASMPIGKPLPNVRCLILDDNQELVPFGIPGELYVGGDGIALGYWQRPELSKERFCFVPKLNQILYRTGDLAKFLPSGDLEYLGRKDFQVKMNGFRVELGEIESTLLRHHYVKQSIVADKTDQYGRKHLVAYWVPSKPGNYSDEVLRDHLVQRLPHYMVPAYFVQLDKMPLTPNGKTDRKQLQDPDWQQYHMREPFRGEIEDKLGKIWQDVFPKSNVGATDHFFLNLGGTSLLSMELVSKIRKSMELAILPAETFLHAPTVRSMATYIEKLRGKSSGSVVIPFQEPHSGQPTVFLLHPISGLSLCFSNLQKSLPNFNLFYLDPYQNLDKVLSLSTIEELASFYLEEIKKVKPHGPYHLVGYSFGGLLAWEIAQQIKRTTAQDSIPLVCLIDSPGFSRLPQPVEEAGIEEYLHTFLHQDLVDEKSKKIFSVFQKMQHSYRPTTYRGTVQYIYATESTGEFLPDHHEPWKQVSSDLVITNSTYNHWNVMEDTTNISKIILSCTSCSANDSA